MLRSVPRQQQWHIRLFGALELCFSLVDKREGRCLHQSIGASFLLLAQVSVHLPEVRLYREKFGNIICKTVKEMVFVGLESKKVSNVFLIIRS